MIAAMRRLHERGRDSRGVVVGGEGAMLGPNCMLVRRTPSGFCCLAPDEAAAIQAAALGPGREPGWLCAQTRRIAEALARGEIALAQIYGLQIPIGQLDDGTLQRLAGVSRLIKANFNPGQPRVPDGNPDGGQWTDSGGSKQTPEPPQADAAADDNVSPGSDVAPSLENAPNIPEEPLFALRERNSIVRRTAEMVAAGRGARCSTLPGHSYQGCLASP